MATRFTPRPAWSEPPGVGAFLCQSEGTHCLRKKPKPTAPTAPRTSPSSRAWKPSASAPACTSARPGRAACTTSSTRSSTTPSTRRSPATATRSASSSTRTTASPSPTTAAASRSGSMEKEGRPAAEVVLTVLHAGGKFGDGGGYKVSGGLHGVGSSVVNALSERLHLKIEHRRHVWEQDYERGKPQTKLEQGDATDEHGTDDHLPARPRDLRRDRLRLRDPGRAAARDRLPHPRPEDRADRRARRDQQRHLPVRRRHRGLRPPPQREQGGAEPQADLLRGREGRRRSRGRDAVEQLLPGVDLQLRQQHQHPRGRHPPVRLPRGADADAERLRPQPKGC